MPEYISDHLNRIIEAYIEYMPYSLFSVMEMEKYLTEGKLAALKFNEEASRPEFQANVMGLISALELFSDESDTEIGQLHFFKTEEWLIQYINHYKIRQEERDLFKVAYSFGFAFSEFLDGLERQGSNRETIILYKRIVKQLTLDTLNQILESDTGLGLNSQMLLKLRLTMHKDEEQPLYGKFGVYSIFKNCSLFWYADKYFRRSVT